MECYFDDFVTIKKIQIIVYEFIILLPPFVFSTLSSMRIPHAFYGEKLLCEIMHNYTIDHLWAQCCVSCSCGGTHHI